MSVCDTFTQGEPIHGWVIAGHQVPEAVYERHQALARQVNELQGILIDNTHALRTILFGSSSALPVSPKEAWEATLEEVRRRLA